MLDLFSGSHPEWLSIEDLKIAENDWKLDIFIILDASKAIDVRFKSNWDKTAATHRKLTAEFAKVVKFSKFLSKAENFVNRASSSTEVSDQGSNLGAINLFTLKRELVPIGSGIYKLCIWAITKVSLDIMLNATEIHLLNKYILKNMLNIDQKFFLNNEKRHW